MDLIHNLPINVRYGDVGHTGVVSLKALADWLQEAAGQSADSLGFGEEELLDYGVTWILTRLVLRLYRLPRAGEDLVVRTWPSTLDRFGRRGYEIYDAMGNLLVSGGSAWAVMDLSTRRMAAIPAHLTGAYPKDAPSCDEFTCRNLPRASADSPSASWSADGNFHGTEALVRVRQDDLDINCHVNNARYLSWLMEALPYTPGKLQFPGLIDLTFRAECFPGDRLLSVSREMTWEGDTPAPDLLGAVPFALAHAIKRVDADGAPGDDVCRAVTLWRQRPEMK